MALARTYDAIFARYADHLPVNFMRALSYRESQLNPNDSGGSHWGLMQVDKNDVIPGYNKRFGTSYTPNDLFNPDINVKIASELINRIVRGYQKHPSPNLQENWYNPDFVKLVVAGWNSGYSEAGGVGRVASYLESKGIPVTHDNVFKYASAAGATTHLQNTSKQNWQRSVADLFYAEGGPGIGGVLVKVAVTAAVAWAVYHFLLR